METHRKPSISVLISAYNKPEFLVICLESFLRQNERDFEIIVTDDGSDETTAQLLDRIKKKSPIFIKHIWQEDQGIRLARVRNLGIKAARGEYILFTDQDCIAGRDLLKDHLENAERGQVLQGNRRLISKKDTETLVNLSFEKIFDLDLKKMSRRHQSEYIFVHGIFRHIGALVDCNLSGFKEDFLSVNMFDESYNDWGGHDFDLGFRMKRKGYTLAFFKDRANLYHLYHPSPRNLLNKGYRRLYKKIIKQSLGFK